MARRRKVKVVFCFLMGCFSIFAYMMLERENDVGEKGQNDLQRGLPLVRKDGIHAYTEESEWGQLIHRNGKRGKVWGLDAGTL